MIMLSAIFTLAAMLGFISVCVWAYWPGRQKEFEKTSQMPLIDDVQASTGAQSHE
jgi:cbb3-type cytochrome oxidase subunit 3